MTAATLIQGSAVAPRAGATDDEVGSATQRDAMLDFLQPLCAEFGVELPRPQGRTRWSGGWKTRTYRITSRICCASAWKPA